jgi:outer membrane protein TolC
LCIFFFSVNANCQSGILSNANIDSNESAIDNFLTKLPDLESLIDSALVHAPLFKLQSIDLRLKELAIENARKNWSKNILSGGASYYYGNDLILNSVQDAGQVNTNSKASSHYSVGLSMKIPISILFDHQDLQKAKMELERTESEGLVLTKSIREEVNTRYLNLINAYQKYSILLDDFESHEINLQNAEKDFKSGKITVQEYTNQTMAYTKAKLEVSEAKNNFNNSIWLLEELIGFKLKF